MFSSCFFLYTITWRDCIWMGTGAYLRHSSSFLFTTHLILKTVPCFSFNVFRWYLLYSLPDCDLSVLFQPVRQVTMSVAASTNSKILRACVGAQFQWAICAEIEKWKIFLRDHQTLLSIPASMLRKSHLLLRHLHQCHCFHSNLVSRTGDRGRFLTSENKIERTSYIRSVSMGGM